MFFILSDLAPDNNDVVQNNICLDEASAVVESLGRIKITKIVTLGVYLMFLSLNNCRNF